VSYHCANFSDANFSPVELDYFLAMKLGLVAAVMALAVASGYLFHCGASLMCA
jgi:hypothetical protein